MSNLREESEHARRTTGHPLYKNERQALIQIAKTWPGNRGVNFKTTTSQNIYLLIMDSRRSIPARAPNWISFHQELFAHMSQDHGLTLTQSEMDDIAAIIARKSKRARSQS